MPNPFGLVSEESFNSKMADISNGLIMINQTLKDSSFYPSSWKMLQKKVRANDMDDIHLGDKIISTVNNVPVEWTIVGKNIARFNESANQPNSLSLMTSRVLEVPAMYYNEPKFLIKVTSSNITSATLNLYTVSITGSQYNFNYSPYIYLSNIIPGLKMIYNYDDVVYYRSTSSNYWYYCPFKVTGSSSTDYTSEWVRSKNTNGSSVSSGISYEMGANNFSYNGYLTKYDLNQTDIQQWLNSDASKNEWWSSKYSGNNDPDYASTLDGFMKMVDSEMLEVLGKTYLDANNSYYFYIPKISDYPYLNSNVNNRIKNEAYWSQDGYVDTNGTINANWRYAHYVAPMCNIV